MITSGTPCVDDDLRFNREMDRAGSLRRRQDSDRIGVGKRAAPGHRPGVEAVEGVQADLRRAVALRRAPRGDVEDVDVPAARLAAEHILVVTLPLETVKVAVGHDTLIVRASTSSEMFLIADSKPSRMSALCAM
jgi:hypothetical protein